MTSVDLKKKPQGKDQTAEGLLRLKEEEAKNN